LRAHVEGLEIVSAGLAHEIQNPLNFIKNAQLLIAENVAKLRQAMEGLPQADPARTATVQKAQQKIGRMVESAGRGVQRIEDVVGLMRRYAREGYPTEPHDVAIDTAVSEVVELVAPRGDINCELDLRLRSPGRTLRAIPEDLNQVIRSLVQNAIEATDGVSSGKIVVSTQTDDRHAILEVTDNGPGVPAENLVRIFSPFFSTKAGPGRGLGLPIVQIVVTRAGGLVEVTSVPGAQTIFRVRLPLASTIAPTLPRSNGPRTAAATASMTGRRVA
jgi:two-component system NtrC family sensor kinase